MSEAAIIVSLLPPTSVDDDGIGWNPDLEKKIYQNIRNLRISGVQEIVVAITYKAEPLRRKLQRLGIMMIKSSNKSDDTEADLYIIGKQKLSKKYDHILTITING